MNPGKVYLVGAGPGDPGLITVKGKACIEKADVLIYDYLASPLLLAHSNPDAEILYVGKKGGDHTLPQDQINDLIVEKARQGKTVTRLKGGDPFIFGRGGEEAEELREAGISFEIVPGVTSAVAAPAYAGIPVTHRSFTSTAALVTGHEDPTKDSSSINWEALAKGIGTIVFLMGVKNLPHITERLMAYGMDKSTPVALVRWGTTTRQQTVTGTLDTIVENVKAAGLAPPCIIVVGQVVSLREKLNWFEGKPLSGKKIVVTRARQQASSMVSRLEELGAEVFEFPTIKVVPPDTWQELDAAMDNLVDYEWLVFTSVNGVKFFFARLFETGRDVRALHRIKTACIGPETAKQLLSFGIRCDILPESYVAEAVVEAFLPEDVKGRKILLPRAKTARPVLPVALKKMGAVVDEIAVYRTEPVTDNQDRLMAELSDGNIDMVTFTSSSTVTNFAGLLPENKDPDLLKDVSLASIGPVTSQTAKDLGFEVDVTAGVYTIPGLCDAIVRFFQDS